MSLNQNLGGRAMSANYHSYYLRALWQFLNLVDKLGQIFYQIYNYMDASTKSYVYDVLQINYRHIFISLKLFF